MCSGYEEEENGKLSNESRDKHQYTYTVPDLQSA